VAALLAWRYFSDSAYCSLEKTGPRGLALSAGEQAIFGFAAAGGVRNQLF
jgi:hypothetical protein